MATVTHPITQPAAARPPRPGVTLPARVLLGQARSVLADAAAADSEADRFCLAHLGALRTAAAVFATRGRPASARRKLISAWVLVETVAPELAEWALFFAAAAPARAAVEAGAVSAVSGRDADDQLRAAEQFLIIVESSLGLLATPLAS
ncbi:MAG: hypothetical protein JWO57_4014 [Pseudonocardiales bacterium]|nr:hypothetical protein [Pseudonocardiales bacterium]